MIAELCKIAPKVAIFGEICMRDYSVSITSSTDLRTVASICGAWDAQNAQNGALGCIAAPKVSHFAAPKRSKRKVTHEILPVRECHPRRTTNKHLRIWIQTPSVEGALKGFKVKSVSQENLVE